MKVKFGSLELEMVPTCEGSEVMCANLPGGFSLVYYESDYKTASLGPRSWLAYMEGPWYDDSNPEAYGVTPQAAISELAEDVINLCNKFKELHDALSCNFGSAFNGGVCPHQS